MKEDVSRKKTAYKAMCQNCREENKRRHKSMKKIKQRKQFQR